MYEFFDYVEVREKFLYKLDKNKDQKYNQFETQRDLKLEEKITTMNVKIIKKVQH